MIEFKRKREHNSVSQYDIRPIIRISQSKRFVVSKLIAKKLDINIETEALMFYVDKNKLFLKKQLKNFYNYHLGVGDAGTYRFRSTDLYNDIKEFLKLEDNKTLFLELNDDCSLELKNF
jgi:hypothetical protein